MKRCSLLCLLALGAVLWPVAQGKASAVDPVITRAQIEADWLRQDEVRGAAVPTGGKNVKPEEDAAGAVDGLITGKWGFHTENEENPWWQVDLGEPTAIGRIVVYNRCDSGCEGRTARMMVLLSADGKQFRQVYQHDGTVFLGKVDNKPLRIELDGQPARYVRLQLPGKSYFHLDEVEIYDAKQPDKNIALGKPATQSSVSTWSARHAAVGAQPATRKYPIALAIERGLKLAEDLRHLGADVQSHAAALRQAAERLKQLPHDAPEPLVRQLYFEVRWTVRTMALRNPLLDFDHILFVKRAPGSFPHVSDQHYGWWSRPGGGIYILENWKSDRRRLRCLTEGFPPGSFAGPDLSYDGQRIVFAYCRYYPHVAKIRDKVRKENLPEDAFYHIFEMNIDGTGVRRLTRGRYDDFDPRYLPSGDIVFLSTRKGVFLQTHKDNTRRTLEADLPDSYVRCGGDNYRPVPVFTLHVMDADGGNLRPISAFENFEWTPSVAHDGRILYARWDYIDRFNGHFFSLWSTNPDGGNAQLVFKNYTPSPQCVFEARAIPDSHKLIFTATAHHSITGGSLVLLDRTRGTEGQEPMTRLTPEVRFPEAEGWDECYYASPWPLSENHYLVAWADRRLPPHTEVSDDRNPPNAQGIYLYDAFGNLNLIYRDPEISSLCPIPLRSRPRPPVIPDSVDWSASEGRFLVQDVYEGLTGVHRGTIRWLRVVAVPPKVQPHMNSPSLGVSKEDPGKVVLGTVPVEEDGSAYFRVPAGMPVFFQAIDEEGFAMQTMRSLTYVMPGQSLSCVGCHESRQSSPPVGKPPLAVLRGPSRLKPGPDGSWPLRFDRLVQPVLDKHCVSCHSPAGNDPAARKFDLTPPQSYKCLLEYADKDLEKLAFERDRSIVGQMPARNSKLMALLLSSKGHYGVRLEGEDLQRLTTWMDTYAQRLGHFSDQQEAELLQLRQQLAPMLEQ